MTHVPNIQKLRPSRKRLRPGDIFVMQLPDGRYLYGRVIRANVPEGEGPWRGMNMIYLYRDPQPTMKPDLGLLTTDRLLCPPEFVNRLGWSRGYFETVLNVPLSSEDLLEQHCFSSNRWTTPYVDEKGRPLASRSEPCGIWAVAGYGNIDEVISRSFGYPEAPYD